MLDHKEGKDSFKINEEVNKQAVGTDIMPENGEILTGEVSLERRFFNLQTLVSFLLAFAIIYFMLTKINIDLRETVENIKRANWLFYLLAFLIYYSSFPVRGLRWRLLLRNVGFRRAAGIRLPSILGLAEIIFLSWFANCLVPAKLGDAYRGYLLKRNARVSLSKTLGTILAERMSDMVVLFIMLALAGLSLFGGKVPAPVMTIFLAGLVLVVLIVLAVLVMKSCGGLVQRLLPARVKPIYGRFEEGTLLSFQNMPLLLLLTVVVWLQESARMWFICLSLGLSAIGLSPVIFMALGGAILTTLPITPAGLGLVESATVGVLLLLNNLGAVHGIDENVAASVAILDRTLSYWSLIVFGLLVYLLSKKK
ncbi:MAG: flippase-like domain-containing protein [Chloroflexi bacterium]|nr:flippase-like domain-containing protein [Chloroflexota bacterium]MCL5074133.1 flippase-like domain-containing protein [Chloroflexota bacterium]